MTRAATIARCALCAYWTESKYARHNLRVHVRKAHGRRLDAGAAELLRLRLALALLTRRLDRLEARL